MKSEKSLQFNIKGAEAHWRKSEPRSQFRTPLRHLKNNTVNREGDQKYFAYYIIILDLRVITFNMVSRAQIHTKSIFMNFAKQKSLY